MLRQLLPSSATEKQQSVAGGSNRSGAVVYSNGKKLTASSAKAVILPDLKSKQRLQPSQTKVLGCQPVTVEPQPVALAAVQDADAGAGVDVTAESVE